MNTITQQIAGEVWNRLTNRFGSNSTQWQGLSGAKEYLTAAKDTGARVYISGLEQALMYLTTRSAAATANQQGNQHQPDQRETSIKYLSEDITTILGAIVYGNPATALKSGRLGMKTALPDEVGIICEWIGWFLTGAGVTRKD